MGLLQHPAEAAHHRHRVSSSTSIAQLRQQAVPHSGHSVRRVIDSTFMPHSQVEIMSRSSSRMSPTVPGPGRGGASGLVGAHTVAARTGPIKLIVSIGPISSYFYRGDPELR